MNFFETIYNTILDKARSFGREIETLCSRILGNSTPEPSQSPLPDQEQDKAPSETKLEQIPHAPKAAKNEPEQAPQIPVPVGTESEQAPQVPEIVEDEKENPVPKTILPEPVAVEKTVAPSEVHTKGFLLGEISKYAAGGKPCRGKLNTTLQELQELYPEAMGDAQKRMERGRRLIQFKTKAAFAKTEQELNRIISDMRSEKFSKYEINSVIKMKDKIQTHRKIQKEMKQKTGVGNAPTRDTPSKSIPQLEPVAEKSLQWDGVHRNLLASLAPAKHWTFLFDETGSDFTENAFGVNVSDITLGRMVALAIPDYANLPGFAGKFHAVDTPLSEVRAANHEILSHSCGVIGIPVNGLKRIHADQWFACIETVLDLALRLLPMDGDTEIEVLVEQRKARPEHSFALQKTCDDCLFHLSRAFPEKSQGIRIHSQIITKNDSPWNGYVDAIAFTWSSPSAKLLLQETEWKDTCLVDSNPELVTACLDLMEREGHLTAQDWNSLLMSRDALRHDSFVGTLLRNLGLEAKSRVELWKNYLDWTVEHLVSKEIHMDRLRAQLSWLKTYQPQEISLPPRVKLLWLVSTLAEANHTGQTPDEAMLQEYRELSRVLYDEDAPLCCFADLHLAVAYTNAFDFDKATATLERWRNVAPSVPGLCYYGQVLSSLGQHEAFRGNNAAAVDLFRRAIETFSRLSDPTEAAKEVSQTAAYLVTSLMDIPGNAAETESELRTYLGANAEEEFDRTICEYATDTRPKDKYRHHILLRYLLSGKADDGLQNVYLCNEGKWGVSTDGHPWEMIEFYRALLIPESEKDSRRKHLETALRIAQDGGPTLRVIAAVILGSFLSEVPGRLEEYRGLVAALREELPLLGDARFAALDAQPTEKLPPLDFARIVLPFNFR